MNRQEINKRHGCGLKTGCTSACLEYFGITGKEFRYSQFTKDVVAILRRKGWSVRSRRSSIPKRATVGGIRNKLRALTLDEMVVAGRHGSTINSRLIPTYLVQVEGHVLLLNGIGSTVVDTDPRKNDRRKVLRIYKIIKQ